jgi:hypothetical protein
MPVSARKQWENTILFINLPITEFSRERDFDSK